MNREGLLDVSGEREHYNLARRLQTYFWPLLSSNYTANVYEMQATQVSRTSQSGSSFAFGMLEGTGPIGSTHYQPFALFSESSDEDVTLRFFDNCPNYREQVLHNATILWQSRQYFRSNLNTISNKVSRQLRLQSNSPWQIQTDIVALYKGCQFDMAIDNRSDRFCALFDTDDIRVFEYWKDLEDYYTRSYGTPLAYQISCLLLVDFFHTIDHIVVAGNDSVQRAKLRFAHAETIIPFISLLVSRLFFLRVVPNMIIPSRLSD